MEVPRLRQARLDQVLTQAELAELAGVAEATVVHAEQGRKVRISTVRKLASALSLYPAELMESRDAVLEAQTERPAARG